MTEKRFNRVGGYVYDGENCISHFEDVAHRDDIITLLNELHEENQRLKKQIHELITGIQETSKLSAEAITKQYAEDKYL